MKRGAARPWRWACTVWRSMVQRGKLHLTPQPRHVVLNRRNRVIQTSGTTPDTRQRCEDMCTALEDCVAYDYADFPSPCVSACIADAASQNCSCPELCVCVIQRLVDFSDCHCPRAPP